MFEEQLAEDAYYKPRTDGACKAAGGQLLRVLHVSGSEVPGDGIARAVPEEKARRLDNCHQRQCDANRARRGVGAELADKVGIGHVIQRRYEHAYYRRHGHTANKPLDRGREHHLLLFRLRHLCVLFLFFV